MHPCGHITHAAYRSISLVRCFIAIPVYFRSLLAFLRFGHTTTEDVSESSLGVQDRIMGERINRFTSLYGNADTFSGHSGACMFLSSGQTRNRSWRPLLLTEDRQEVIVSVVSGKFASGLYAGSALTRPVLDYFHRHTSNVLKDLEVPVSKGGSYYFSALHCRYHLCAVEYHMT